MKDEMQFQEIDFKRSYYKLKSKRRVVFATVILTTLISLLGVFLYNLTQDETAIYKGYTTVEVTPAEGKNDQLKVVNDIFWSDTVFTRMRSNLGTDTQISVLKSNTEIEESLIGQDTNKTSYKVSFSDQDGDRAKEVSNLLAQQARKLVVDTMEVNSIEVVGAPELSTNVSYEEENVNIFMITLLGFIGGLTLSVIGVFVWYYFNDTVIYSEDIEKN